MELTEKQFTKLAKKLIKSTVQRQAVKLHMLDGLTAYEAEKRIHGRATATVLRDARRINELFETCKDVMQ